MKAGFFKKGMDQMERVAGRAGNDTLKLWEGYREQAYLWRTIALLQMPATALAVFATLVMFFFADTIIQVPPKPMPGYYSVRELPDTAFIDVANDVVSLLANYQPARAEYQFGMVQRYLWEPALSSFQLQMPSEVDKIVTTGRSQYFIPDQGLTKVKRDQSSGEVTVTLRGERHKFVKQQKLEPDIFEYNVKMVTIPRNISNEYGIVVISLGASKPDLEAEKRAERP